MADSFTTSLLLRKPETGANQNAWGPLANEDFGSERLEQAIVGIQAYTLSGSKTLTRLDGETDECRMRVQLITGGTGGTVNVNAAAQWHWFYAGSSGDVTVTNGSNSVVVKAGNGVPVISDGTNIYQLRCLDYGSDLPKSSGTPTVSTDLVTKEYADNLAFGSSLPGQTGNAGGILQTDGTNASWAAASTIKTTLSLNNVDNKSSATIRAEFAAAANTYSGKQTMKVSAGGGAGLNLGQGTAPSSPVAGDVWETADGLFYYDGTRTVGVGKWTQIGSPVATTSGSAITFSSIPSGFSDLLLVFKGVSTDAVTGYQITLSNNGSTFSTGVTVGSSAGASSVFYGAIEIPGYRQDTGLLRQALQTATNLSVQTASTGTVLLWRVDGGINHVRISAQADTFDAGSITLFAR